MAAVQATHPGLALESGGGLAKIDTKPRTANTVYIVCLTIWFHGLRRLLPSQAICSVDLKVRWSATAEPPSRDQRRSVV